MKIGIVLPQTEIGHDPIALRDFAQAAEEGGFSHILIYDHVLGAQRDRPGGWKGPYDSDDSFHEPFVTFAYLAAFTKTIGLCTGVIILPQRQAVLVAKQAAQVDVLCGGRLRLGVGTGWNQVEYAGLNVSFSGRGKRQEEQIHVMRQLWENDVVTFKGDHHDIQLAGIKPRPAKTIPIWFGGGVDAVLKRAARIGDGWFPLMGFDKASAAVEKIMGYLEAEGRDPKSFGIEPHIRVQGGSIELHQKRAEGWRDLGATHLAVHTMGAGLKGPEQHVRAALEVKQAVS